MKLQKLQTRILAGYLIIVVMFIVVTVLSFFQFNKLNGQVEQLTKVEFLNYQINRDMSYQFSEMSNLVSNYMYYKTNKYKASFENLAMKNAQLCDQLAAMEDASITSELLNSCVDWRDTIKDSLFPAVLENDQVKVQIIAARVAPQTQAIITFFDERAAERKSNIDQIQESVGNSQSSIVIVLFSSTGIALLMALALGFFLTRSITRPINKLVKVAKEISGGNLDVKVDVKRSDEIGTLATAFNEMSDNLNEVMTNINISAGQVFSGSKQVSDSSMALSQGATEQASSIEELTASLEEISIQTKKNADNANEANSIADTARLNAMKGNEHMLQMLNAMDEINQSSKSISKVIKVIDEIAFQTNILALNASVEAARAGQYGRGFAVVADEVRNLAARSAKAAKETTNMIEGSIKKVDIGAKIANETANALDKIVTDVKKVADLVGDIKTSSNEQAAGITQINQGIMQVSEVVQTNSATSEESAAASEELAGQADLLKEQVSKFRLRNANDSADTNPEDQRDNDSMNEFGDHEAVDNRENSVTPKIALSDQEFANF